MPEVAPSSIPPARCRPWAALLRRCPALLGALVAVLGGAASGRPAYELVIDVDPDRRALSGRARIRFTNDSDTPLQHLLLWSYPDRFATRPAALNDYNRYWIYPYRFSPGGLQVEAARRDGRPVPVDRLGHPHAGPRALLRLPLDPPLPPGASAVVELDYRVQLPLRYGAFGCSRGGCILGGGFYPMLPPLGPGGFDLQAPPARADFDLVLTAPRRSDVIVQGELTPLAARAPRRAALRDERAPLVLIRRPSLRTRAVEHRGVRIELHLTWPRPVPSPPHFVVPYWPPDREGRVLKAARASLDLLAALGLPLPTGQVLHLFEGALRTEVAQALPGAVLVSDQIFDLLPLKSLMAAHERELIRAIFELYAGRVAGDRERPADQGWAPDVAASFLTDRYTRGQHQASVGGDVAKVGFLPEADRILFAPQIPFSTAYFDTLAAPDPFRDRLAEFNNDWPRGKTVYAKLLDLLGEAAVERIVRRQLAGAPIRAAAEAVYGGPLGWFFAQWVGPYPKVDYRLREVRRSQQGGRHQVELVVEKRGERPPVEPVEVQVRDGGGREQRQRWDGRGREHRFVFSSDRPFKRILLDPRGRLVEDLPGSNEDLKFGERLPPRWKALLGDIVLAFGAGALDVGVDMNLWRVRDVKNSLNLGVLHNQLNDIAVSGQYTRWFGKKVTPARLAWGVSGGLSLARVPSLGHSGNESVPGQAFTFRASLLWDDRQFIWEPQRARTLNLAISYTLTVLDNAAVFHRGNASASWQWLARLADGHGLALLVSGALAFGQIATAQQLVSAGGPGGLRAFARSELLGRASLLGRAEYRHVFTRSLNLGVLSAYYLRGLSGALFAEAGVITPCQSYAVDQASPAADVGYTVSFIGQWFGLSPNQFSVGAAAPLLRPARGCLGADAAPDKAPVGMIFSFGAPW